jgi:uncharacterized surface protein with fasciclin (FAS1) repeats
MRLFAMALMAVLLPLTVVACGEDEMMSPEEMELDIVDTAAAAGSFNTLIAAVQAAGLEATLRGPGPLTVFAPTDAAFAALPAGTVETLLMPENIDQLIAILTYHVVADELLAADVLASSAIETVQGQSLDVSLMSGAPFVDAAGIVDTNIETSNGVIHVIDSVLLPNTLDLVDTAAGAGVFGTLIAAVQAAGLETTLRGPGPFTVFAPTDAAFAALPAGTVESLLLPENIDQLAAILTYHVVADKLLAADVLGLTTIETVQGQSLDVSLVEGAPFVDASGIIDTNIETSNGVVHVIDSVLLPE